MRKSRSILEELDNLVAERDRNLVIENRAEHIINSAINLIEQIEKTFNDDAAKDLTNRFLNSIRGRDSTKFSRGIKKAVAESKKSTRI
jgi:hypothetical protein